jgi:hypothetical protein
MCVIINLNKGVSISKETLEDCFIFNGDGGGIMWNRGGVNYWSKGFMTFEEFYKENKHIINNTKIPRVIHFRITSQGTTNKGQCHPYPLSANRKHYSQLRGSTRNQIIAMNGTLSIKPQAGMNDTQTSLYMLAKHGIKNVDKDVLGLVSDTVKWSVLNKNGTIERVGTWDLRVSDNGDGMIEFSNVNHELYYGYAGYNGDYGYAGTGYKSYNVNNRKNRRANKFKKQHKKDYTSNETETPLGRLFNKKPEDNPLLSEDEYGWDNDYDYDTRDYDYDYDVYNKDSYYTYDETLDDYVLRSRNNVNVKYHKEDCMWYDKYYGECKNCKGVKEECFEPCLVDRGGIYDTEDNKYDVIETKGVKNNDLIIYEPDKDKITEITPTLQDIYNNNKEEY